MELKDQTFKMMTKKSENPCSKKFLADWYGQIPESWLGPLYHTNNVSWQYLLLNNTFEDIFVSILLLYYQQV